MGLYESYLEGETIGVYDQIEALGQDAFLPRYLPDIEKVLDETFRRVSFNLTIIYDELKSIGYQLGNEFGDDFERPLIRPETDVEKLLRSLGSLVKPYGRVPLSLQYFYRHVGACNFSWDYAVDSNIRWQLADPIQINPLSALITDLDEGGLDLLADEYEENGLGTLPLAADYLHKDNISGGDPYSIQLTTAPSIDSAFLNEPHKTTFINYLRICFDHCGFPGMADASPDFEKFCARIRPQLKRI